MKHIIFAYYTERYTSWVYPSKHIMFRFIITTLARYRAHRTTSYGVLGSTIFSNIQYINQRTGHSLSLDSVFGLLSYCLLHTRNNSPLCWNINTSVHMRSPDNCCCLNQYVQLKVCSQSVLSSMPKQTTHEPLPCLGRTGCLPWSAFAPFSTPPSLLVRFGRPDNFSVTPVSPFEPCPDMVTDFYIGRGGKLCDILPHGLRIRRIVRLIYDGRREPLLFGKVHVTRGMITYFATLQIMVIPLQKYHNPSYTKLTITCKIALTKHSSW